MAKSTRTPACLAQNQLNCSLLQSLPPAQTRASSTTESPIDPVPILQPPAPPSHLHPFFSLHQVYWPVFQEPTGFSADLVTGFDQTLSMQEAALHENTERWQEQMKYHFTQQMSLQLLRDFGTNNPSTHGTLLDGLALLNPYLQLLTFSVFLNWKNTWVGCLSVLLPVLHTGFQKTLEYLL